MKINFNHYSNDSKGGYIEFDKDGAVKFNEILRDLASDLTDEDGFDAQTVRHLCQSIEEIEELLEEMNKTEVQA